MAYTEDFARSVFRQVGVALGSDDSEIRKKEMERWTRAGIAVPKGLRDYGAVITPAEIVWWAARNIDSKDPEERAAAVRILARLDWAAVEANMEEAAGQLMADLGPRCQPLLITQLSSGDRTQRRIVMYALAYLGRAAASHADAIGNELRNFPNEASMPLVTMGEAGTPWLVAGLHHQRREVRNAVLRAIQFPEVEWPPQLSNAVLDAIIENLSNSDEETSRLAMDALESAGYAGASVVAHYEMRADDLEENDRQKLLEVIASIRDGEKGE